MTIALPEEDRPDSDPLVGGIVAGIVGSEIELAEVIDDAGH